MIVQAIKTDVIYPNAVDLLTVIDGSITVLENESIVAISSKLVSLCEGNVVSVSTKNKDKLIIDNSQLHISRTESEYNAMITVVHNSLMLAAGIDESNSDGMYVLWPKDPLKTAKAVYDFLANKWKVQSIGVIIVDSTSRPLRIGTIGTSIAHWGFNDINDYRGSKDLFGKKLEVSQANIAESLASAAVVVMGEGTEQTPIAIISDTNFVHFDTTAGGSCYNNNSALESDVYWPALKSAPWQK